MERRKALKIATGAIVTGGAGIFALSASFKPEYQPLEEARKVEYNNSKTSWEYHALNPVFSAESAYKNYDSGSCMYATFNGIISQLAEKYGEPYSSFPVHMMKYGHGGIGGFGSVCGALNAAGAVIGLFVAEKSDRDTLITGMFRWYEETSLPEFRSESSALDLPKHASGSTLCHASNTIWSKEAGYKINSEERKERCRRLTSDVAARLTVLLNEYFNDSYMTSGAENESVRTCMTCHGETGKLANTNTKMSCDPCHSESIGHKVFAGIHHELMKPG